MATLSNALHPLPNRKSLRPFDVRRDLRAVADLVEQCFSENLDADGKRYIRHMRSAAGNPRFLHWANAVVEKASMPLSGYVWEEDRQIVGNLSLIPFYLRSGRIYLIANVAVHPDYRRRRIAYHLTSAALDHARSRKASATWLQVREDNEPAVKLYHSLNFQDRTIRTTWHSNNPTSASVAPLSSSPAVGTTENLQTASPYTIGSLRSDNWAKQKSWLERLYPRELSWHLPIDYNALRSGLLGAVYRVLTGGYLRHWAVCGHGQLLGALTWKPTSNSADSLWLALPPTFDEAAVYALLVHARQQLSPFRSLALDFPARLADAPIRAAGFHEHQTLIWMSNEFRS